MNLHDTVIAQTKFGRLEGVIVGKAYTIPPHYDVQTRKGRIMNVPAADVTKREVMQ